MKAGKRLGALVALALAASLVVPATAQSQQQGTSYEIAVGQSFFHLGIKAFSARIYPGSIKVHAGDTIRFSEMIAFLPAGVYPQDYIPENMLNLDGKYSFLQADPDDGANAVKLNLDDPSVACGRTQADACQWGQNAEPIFPAGPLEGDPEPDSYHVWATIDATPGTVLWGTSIPGSEVNTNIKVEVVAQNEAASTQEELDQRAAQLIRKDYEDTLALYSKMKAKRTSHINAAGKRVFDVWAGGMSGPIEFFDYFPRRIRVPRGARVMFHFQDELEPHTTTFGGRRARRIADQNLFLPVCDPDGDDGAGPDVSPDFSNPEQPCTPPGELELDMNSRAIYETGDHRVTGPRDYENSGVKDPVFPEQTTFDSNPWTVRMTKVSDRAYRYFCIVHGSDFMFGKVVVK